MESLRDNGQYSSGLKPDSHIQNQESSGGKGAEMCKGLRFQISSHETRKATSAIDVK